MDVALLLPHLYLPTYLPNYLPGEMLPTGQRPFLDSIGPYTKPLLLLIGRDAAEDDQQNPDDDGDGQTGTVGQVHHRCMLGREVGE